MVSNQALTKTDTHLHSLMVTMSQKSFVPQAAKSVSQALMSDSASESNVFDNFGIGYEISVAHIEI